MLQKSRAVVLHTYKYGDASLIVHCYTEQWGRRSFLLKGVRKASRQHRMNYYQPLFLLDLDVYYRDNRELQWIKEASFIDHIPGFQTDVKRSAQALFLTEVLMKVLKEEEKNEPLFDFLYRTVSYFESIENASASFHILFLFQLTRFLGFYPGKNFGQKYRYFNVITGSFSNAPPSSEIEKEKLLGKFWNTCFDATYLTIDQAINNQMNRNLFLDSLLDFYRYHFDLTGNLKSTEVLRSLFS